MKKLNLLIVCLMLFMGSYCFAGGYEEPYSQQQQYQPEQIVNDHIMEKHYYLEMAIGGGTLFLGALGLWLKYGRKK